MTLYDNLIAREYVSGKVDCYSIIRDFYGQVFDIQLPNYARPKDWWNMEADLYMDRYYKHGFRSLDVHPSEYQFGDVILISYMSKVANHAGVLVENGKILHHFTNRLSSVDPYRGVWKNNTVAVMRHKDVVISKTEEVADITEFLPHNIKRKIDVALQNREVAPKDLR